MGQLTLLEWSERVHRLQHRLMQHDMAECPGPGTCLHLIGARTSAVAKAVDCLLGAMVFYSADSQSAGDHTLVQGLYFLLDAARGMGLNLDARMESYYLTQAYEAGLTNDIPEETVSQEVSG